MTSTKRPLKLLIVSGVFHPEIGGPSRYLYNLAKYLHEQGHQVTVVAFSAEPSSYHYPYKVVRILRKNPLPLRLLYMFNQIMVHGIRADLLFVNDYGLPPILANFLLKKPIVMKIVGDWAWEYSVRHQLYDKTIDEFQETTHQGKSLLVQKIQAFYVSQVQQIITPSGYLKNIVQGWLKEPVPIQVIYNALDPQHYHFPKTKEAAKKELGFSFRYILTIARLNPWKGVDAVIKSLPLLPDDVHYVVVGEGPEYSSLLELSREMNLQDRVHLVGRCDLEKNR